MTAFQQIAFVSSNLSDEVRRLSQLGASKWIHDTVDAVHLWEREPDPDTRTFGVRLAFNYELFPDKELELIQLLEGRTCQLIPLCGPRVVSHVGYHVTDYVSDPDAIEREIVYWHGLGSPCLQVSQTVRHAGTSQRYRYAFVFDRHFPQPMWVKIIQRIGSGDDVPSVDEGRKRFRFLGAGDGQ
jgi:hypothetical protein